MNISIKNPAKADIFASIFQHIKLFTDQINIMFDPDRMYIQTMDNSRVSVVEISIPNKWFDVYEKTSSSNICIGISSTAFFKILNARDKSQEVLIDYSEDDCDKLFVKFSSENKSVFDKYFEIPLMYIDSELLEIPQINSEADLTMCSTNFANIVNQLQMFGDALDISCSEDKIILTSNSQDIGKMYVDIGIDDLNSFAINDGQTMNLSFSLKYLHNICMYCKIAKEVEIKLTNSYPMKIIYNLDDEDTKMTFYLAPKINDD